MPLSSEDLGPLMRAIDGVGKSLIEAATKNNPQHYTLTGAEDWTIFVWIAGIGVAAVSIIASLAWNNFMASYNKNWAELKELVKGHRDDGRCELNKLETQNIRDHDLLWDKVREMEKEQQACKDECLRRRVSSGQVP